MKQEAPPGGYICVFQRTRVIVVSSKYTYVLILALYDIPNRRVLSPRVLLRTVPYCCARRARSKSSYSHPATHAGTHSHRAHSTRPTCAQSVGVVHKTQLFTASAHFAHFALSFSSAWGWFDVWCVLVGALIAACVCAWVCLAGALRCCASCVGCRAGPVLNKAVRVFTAR